MNYISYERGKCSLCFAPSCKLRSVTHEWLWIIIYDITYFQTLLWSLKRNVQRFNEHDLFLIFFWKMRWYAFIWYAILSISIGITHFANNFLDKLIFCYGNSRRNSARQLSADKRQAGITNYIWNILRQS